MELNKVYAEDCFVTMEKMIEEGIKVNNIITSPFYNTCRATSYHKTQKSRDNYEGRDVRTINIVFDILLQKNK